LLKTTKPSQRAYTIKQQVIQCMSAISMFKQDVRIAALKLFIQKIGMQDSDHQQDSIYAPRLQESNLFKWYVLLYYVLYLISRHQKNISTLLSCLFL